MNDVKSSAKNEGNGREWQVQVSGGLSAEEEVDHCAWERRGGILPMYLEQGNVALDGFWILRDDAARFWQRGPSDVSN